MIRERTVKYKSYILVDGFSEEELQDVRNYLDSESFKSVGIKSGKITDESLQQESHSLSCFVKSNDHAGILACVEAANKVGIPCHIFSDLSFEVEFNLKPFNTQLKSLLPSFFSELLPKKIKDLCVFSVNSILPNLIPDVKNNLAETLSKSGIGPFNIQVHCETVAKNFVGAITFRADTNILRSKSEVLNSISNEDIMDCLAEVTNQTLGVINYNLKKINIDARIGLPTIVNSQTEYNMRSSFYLPLCVLNDPENGISCKFYILYPFLKGTELLGSVDFEIGVQHDDDVELF